MKFLLFTAAMLAAGSAWPQATQTVIVTGNPLAREDIDQPASVLSGDGLVLRRAGTLGDTLSGLPGVAGSGFNPQASRPVIRGLDGDRIRLLDNGGASIDASNLSFDHAAAIDPLVVERIEVLRGPAALLYGGNATGGVVNTVHNRIPRAPIADFTGRAELRFGGAANERAGVALLEGGAGALAWHVDAAERSSDDLRVPRYTPIEDGVPLAPATRVRNSAGRSNAAAVGASWADADGFVGVSLDGLRNRYGVTIEPDVTIRMNRERLSLAGERRKLDGPFSQFEFAASRTRYQHEEIEGSGEVGTTFKSTGSELRLQGRHAPIGALRGALGVAAEDLRFSALGEEAFVPNTRTRSAALFALEEFELGALTLGAGARAERVRVASEGDAPGAAPRFGAPSERRFDPTSASLSARWTRGPWSLSASLGHTERAPAYYELYANGVHVATGAFERGDASLGAERSRHAELGAGWSNGAHRVKASVYATRFARYIALDTTGANVDVVAEDGSVESFPEYAFRAVPARLHGFEIEARTRLTERPWTLDLATTLDLVRGRNSDTGEPLPRLAPLRLGLALEAARGAWQGGVSLRRAAAQTRVPATDVPTPGHTLLNLWLAYRAPLFGADALWFVRLDNALNELAYNAAALQPARELAPLAGRALAAGVRVQF
jgi:iron complex outermembrane receptor protein